MKKKCSMLAFSCYMDIMWVPGIGAIVIQHS